MKHFRLVRLRYGVEFANLTMNTFSSVIATGQLLVKLYPVCGGAYSETFESKLSAPAVVPK